MRSISRLRACCTLALLGGVILAVAGCGKSFKQKEAERVAAEVEQKVALAKRVELSKQQSRKAVEEGVRQAMKDPASVKIRDVTFFASYLESPPTPESMPQSHVICGEVNAKNSYGGYVGFRAFVATVVIDPATFQAYEGTFIMWLDPGGDEYHRRDFLFVQKRDCQDTLVSK